MRRVDPFFQNATRPHKNGYLESLHRTYGEPPSALPTRGDILYERAYAYRQREKAKYEEIEREANEARLSSVELLGKYKALEHELEQIRPLFKELSKARGENAPYSRLDPRPDEPSGCSTRDSEHADGDASDCGVRTVVQLPDAGKGARGEGGGGVPEGALRDDGDVRGQADEHAAQGSEPRGGSAAATDAADAGECVGEAQE